MKHLSELARESWEKYYKIQDQLVVTDDNGQIVGCCVIGGIALALGCDIDAIPGDNINWKTRMVAEWIDQQIGCEVLMSDWSEDDTFACYSHIVAMNDDPEYDPIEIFTELDAMEQEACS